MSECNQTAEVQRFHDGELNAARAQAVRIHLRLCPECAAALEDAQRLSVSLAQVLSAEMTPGELTRLHVKVDEIVAETEPQPLHFPWVGAVLAAAASLMVIAAAWLALIQPPKAQSSVASAPTPDWWNTAVTLQVEPLPASLGQTDMADARLADYFLDNLHGGERHVDN